MKNLKKFKLKINFSLIESMTIKMKTIATTMRIRRLI